MQIWVKFYIEQIKSFFIAWCLSLPSFGFRAFSIPLGWCIFLSFDLVVLIVDSEFFLNVVYRTVPKPFYNKVSDCQHLLLSHSSLVGINKSLYHYLLVVMRHILAGCLLVNYWFFLFYAMLFGGIEYHVISASVMVIHHDGVLAFHYRCLTASLSSFFPTSNTEHLTLSSILSPFCRALNIFWRHVMFLKTLLWWTFIPKYLKS